MRLAQAAFVVGMLFAAVSVYWALGGMWLLATVDRSIEEQARAGNKGLILAAWAAAILKVSAAVLPLLALRRFSRPVWNRSAWLLAWLSAAILSFYGLVQTAVSQAVLVGFIDMSSAADHRALAWHTYLWDPWFLIWGLLVTAALLRSRHHRGQVATHG